MSLPIVRSGDPSQVRDLRRDPPAEGQSLTSDGGTALPEDLVVANPQAAVQATATADAPTQKGAAPAERERQAPPPTLLHSDEAPMPALADDGVVESNSPLGPQTLKRLAQETCLRPDALRTLQHLHLSQSVVATSVTNRPIADDKLDRLAERYDGMNRYGGEQEGGHIEETAGPERDFPHMGLLTVYVHGENGGQKEDLAYASMYPASVDKAVASRTGLFANHTVADGTSEYYADALTRVDWDQLAGVLSQKTPGHTVGVGDIMHLTDYAVGPNAENLESNGLARVALKLMEGHLKNNQMMIGFIDSTPPESADDLDHRTSTLASMSTGCFLAGCVPTSHDGDHPSILVAYSPSFEPAFAPSDTVVAERKPNARLDLGQFIPRCEQLLNDHPKQVIAFDSARQAYVLTSLKPRDAEPSTYLMRDSI